MWKTVRSGGDYGKLGFLSKGRWGDYYSTPVVAARKDCEPIGSVRALDISGSEIYIHTENKEHTEIYENRFLHCKTHAARWTSMCVLWSDT